jgi:pimeloyl-ACP methyl ester carboxylesterase
MRIVDVGRGAPVILVPGIQGRWEWMKPAVDALSARCRVVTFSFADEPTCGGRFEAARGFDCYVEQVREAMDAAGISSAVIAGVSYGGLIAAAFAARHPDRASGLVLVSAIPPQWVPNARVRFFLRAPRLLSPLFMVNSLRMYKEIAAAVPGVLPGMAAAARHGFTVLTHMMSPGRMARRVHLLEPVKLDRELADVHVPTLVITGDAALDNVVPVQLTEEYTRLWPHAERVTIPRTGHLGLITRPDAFASAVVPFVERHALVRLTTSAKAAVVKKADTTAVRLKPDTTAMTRETKVG